MANTSNQIYITKEGLKTLKEELDHLKNVKRKEVLDRLKEAISYGDLSENSEYEESKNEQAFVEGRIIELEEKIKKAKIIAEKTGSNKASAIQIGVTVKIQNLTDEDEPETYTIVGSTEADPMNNKISNESPIGMAIMGKQAGDVVKVSAPAGVLEYKVLSFK